MSNRLLALVIAVYALAAAWFSFKPLGLPSAQALKVAEDHWLLSSGQALDADDALSAIAAAHLFSPATAPGAVAVPVDEKPLTPPGWRIAGVFASGGQYVALQATEGDVLPKQLHVGDRLPGGAKILRITPDRICISLNGKTRSITTYKE